MARTSTMLELDAEQFQNMINDLARNTTPEQFNRIISRSLKRAGSAVRTAVKREISTTYHITASRALSAMSTPVISESPANMTIYVKGVRERIGPTGPYPAWSVGMNGPSGRKRRNIQSRSGNVTMEDVRGVRSTLPAGLGSDARHFMVMRGPYAGRVFAAIPKSAGSPLYIKHIRGKRICRYARANEKIRVAVGIAIPQMPLNRSAPAIQMRFEEIFQKRIAHEWKNVMAGIGQSSRRGRGNQ